MCSLGFRLLNGLYHVGFSENRSGERIIPLIKLSDSGEALAGDDALKFFELDIYLKHVINLASRIITLKSVGKIGGELVESSLKVRG